MQDVIFREYDIRGKVDEGLLLDRVYELGCAIAFYLVSKNEKLKTVVLGMDGRTHSPAIKKELTRAFIDSGLDVVFIGIVPTPVVYFATYTLPVDAGIMITASHNPKEYNGIKICLGNDSVWGKEIRIIRDLYNTNKSIKAQKKGTYTEKNLIPIYINYLADQFPHLKNMQLSAVVDCANAVGGVVLPELIVKMNWKQVQLLYCTLDGTYPNHEADPVVEKNMAEVKKALQTTHAQVGIGLDGDCDRMAAMTKSGYLVPGDKLLALFAQYMKVPEAVVVYDIKSSAGLPELLTQWNIKPVVSPSGHSIIKDTMKEMNAKLGGELSCHFFFNDRYFGYDDAIYAMMRLFEILIETNKPLDELIKVFPKKFTSREFRISCAEDKKQKTIQHAKKYFEQKEAKILTIDGIRVETSDGWGLLRASNTQPVLCFRFESVTSDGLKKIKNEFITALSNYYDSDRLKKEFEL